MKNLEQFKKLNRTELSAIKGKGGPADDREPLPVPYFLCPECYMIAAFMATRGLY